MTLYMRTLCFFDSKFENGKIRFPCNRITNGDLLVGVCSQKWRQWL